MAARARTRTVETPQGKGKLFTSAAADPQVTLVLSHGAGSGPEAHDLAALAHALPAQGVTVHLFEQPWHVAGRKIAPAPAVLDEAFSAAIALVRKDLTTPLVLGGRSAGARSAVRLASEWDAVGTLLLAFPLHAPGKNDGHTKLAELLAVGVSTLIIQGERDTFGRPEEFAGADGQSLPASIEMTVVPAADHALTAPVRSGLTLDDIDGIVVESALEWLFTVVVGTE